MRNLPFTLAIVLCLSCSSGAGRPRAARPTTVPPPVTADAARSRPNDPAHEVVVTGPLGAEQLEWIEPGDVAFATEGGLVVPLIYAGGDAISWDVRSDGAITVDDRIVGWDLTDLDTDQIRRFAAERRGTLQTLVVGGLLRLEPELVTAIEELAAPELALSIGLTKNGEVFGAELLDALAPRLRALAIEAEMGAELDLARIAAFPRLRALRLANAMLLHVEALAALPELRSLCLDVPYINPPPFNGEHIAHLAPLHALRRLELVGADIMDDDLAVVARLRELRALKFLGVDEARVTSAGVVRFVREHPDCYVEHMAAAGA